MNNNDEIRDELNKLSPFLAKQKEKDLGYSVPKNYFNSLPDEVMKKIGREVAPVRRSWLDDLAALFNGLLQPKYVLAMASVALLIVAAIYFTRQPKDIVQGVTHIELKDIPDEALFSYISDNIQDFDKDLILESNQFEQKDSPLQNIAPKPNLQELEQYLDDNLDNIDLDDLQEIL